MTHQDNSAAGDTTGTLDADQIAKVERADALVRAGSSQARATAQVGLPRPSFARWHKKLVKEGRLKELPKVSRRGSKLAEIDIPKIGRLDALVRGGMTRKDASKMEDIDAETFKRHHNRLVEEGLLGKLPSAKKTGKPVAIDIEKVKRTDALVRDGMSETQACKQQKINRDTFKRHHNILVEAGTLEELPPRY
jgi:transposase